MLVWLLQLCFVSQTGTKFNVEQDPQLTHKRNIEARSRNHCCHAKAISVTYCVCVCVPVALVIQHEKRMRRIILSSVDSLALP
jgi:hypothetical protein